MSCTRFFPRCVLFSGLLSTRVVASCVPPIVAAPQRALVDRFQKTITVLHTPTRVRSSISTLAEKPIPRGIDRTLRGLAPFPAGVRRTSLVIPTQGSQSSVLKSLSFILRVGIRLRELVFKPIDAANAVGVISLIKCDSTTGVNIIAWVNQGIVLSAAISVVPMSDGHHRNRLDLYPVRLPCRQGTALRQMEGVTQSTRRGRGRW